MGDYEPEVLEKAKQKSWLRSTVLDEAHLKLIPTHVLKPLDIQHQTRMRLMFPNWSELIYDPDRWLKNKQTNLSIPEEFVEGVYKDLPDHCCHRANISVFFQPCLTYFMAQGCFQCRYIMREFLNPEQYELPIFVAVQQKKEDRKEIILDERPKMKTKKQKRQDSPHPGILRKNKKARVKLTEEEKQKKEDLLFKDEFKEVVDGSDTEDSDQDVGKILFS